MTDEPKSKYEGDTATQMVYDTLSDRGFDQDELEARIDAYAGDFWMDFFGPMLDTIEEVLFSEEEIAEVHS